MTTRRPAKNSSTAMFCFMFLCWLHCATGNATTFAVDLHNDQSFGCLTPQWTGGESGAPDWPSPMRDSQFVLLDVCGRIDDCENRRFKWRRKLRPRGDY